VPGPGRACRHAHLISRRRRRARVPVARVRRALPARPTGPGRPARAPTRQRECKTRGARRRLEPCHAARAGRDAHLRCFVRVPHIHEGPTCYDPGEFSAQAKFRCSVQRTRMRSHASMRVLTTPEIARAKVVVRRTRAPVHSSVAGARSAARVSSHRSAARSWTSSPARDPSSALDKSVLRRRWRSQPEDVWLQHDIKRPAMSVKTAIQG
jgi:hypothetical protein